MPSNENISVEPLSNIEDLLRLAAVRGHLGTLQSILSKTNYSPENTSQILHIALKVPLIHDEQLKERKENIFDFFVKSWPQLFEVKTEEENNILHTMAENNFPQLVERYSPMHIDLVFKINKLGHYPITCSILNGHYQITKLFLQIPGVSKLEDPKGRLPIHYAVYYSDVATVLLCLAADSTVIDHADKNEQTSLHLACIANKQDILNTLLEGGANVNKVDSLGRTALHYAVINKNRAIIDKLLSHPNIDLGLADQKGFTVLDYVFEPELKELLRSKGALATGKIPDESLMTLTL